MNNMKTIRIILAALLLVSAGATAGNVKMRVSNAEKNQRQELIELQINEVYKQLGISAGQPFVVRDAIGSQQDYQITYDGKLIFEVTVCPGGTAEYTIAAGVPRKMHIWTQGRFYPERMDDIAWENDRGAYRVYGPALQRSGEKAYGIDVWTKNQPDTVLDMRYRMNREGNVETMRLKKAGNREAANESRLATSFHIDHGYGLDAYKVGPTLGCGTPALMVDGALVMPYCFSTYKILDNGPLRFTVALTYNPAVVGRDRNVIEHRIISLDKNSNFNKMTVWYEGLTARHDLAAGVVIHEEDTESVVVGDRFVQYADPTDDPRHQYQLYVGALFPNGVSATKKLLYDKPADGAVGHAIGVVRNIGNNQKYSYYFGSAWSKADVRSQAEWQLRIDEFLKALDAPLKVELTQP